MNIVAGVIIYKDQAFVPTTSQVVSGPHLDTDPIEIVPLDAQNLADALGRAIERGNPRIPPVNYEEYRRNDPTLKATSAKSWKALARAGASYGVIVDENEIALYISKLDKQGRFVDDNEKTQRFPRDTDLAVIAHAILTDWRSRSKV
jgi:hypothetical protein